MSEDAPASAIARLAEVDGGLRDVARSSMAPDRERATSFEALGEIVLRGVGPRRAEVFAEGFDRLARAVRESFPENLFWDFDRLAGVLARAPEDAMRGAFDDLVQLHELFGRATAIRFRYVHDFLYGYDWAKWVARDPEARADLDPYSPAFFAAMLSRGRELLALIAEDDPKYHRLRGEGHRNPFGFSREPSAERALHRRLAARGAIPVEAWRVGGAARWDLDFYGMRERCAEELRLTPRSTAPPTT